MSAPNNTTNETARTISAAAAGTLKQLAFELGESTDLEQLLEAQLLSSVLLENSASPLQHLLETTELGLAPSPLCGLEDSMREMVFCCGIEGSEAEHADALEALDQPHEEIAVRGARPDEALVSRLLLGEQPAPQR